ncbi:MAG: Hsp20/alpha crystallin family protein [Thermodesulfobacteriota bacterium]
MKRFSELIPWKRKNQMVSRQPENTFNELQQRMDGFFDNVFPRGWMTSDGLMDTAGLLPRLDVREEKKKIIVEAEMPGVDSKDIDVSLDGRLLKIKAEKRQESQDEGKGFFCSERSYGCYQRTVELPAEVDDAKVEATYKKGVLTIELKKVKESETRKIEVKSM